jgi:hypothetical protein
MLAVRIRSYLVRHRRVHWALVACLALAAGTIVVQHGREVDQALASWGTTSEVWVADRSVEPGQLLVARAAGVPQAVVPVGALSAPPPAGSLAAQHLSDGEIVTVHDVAGGPGDLVPVGWRTVAVGVDERSLVVAVGDPVDVAADGALLASGGRVVTVGPSSVAVAVPADVAAAVAASALEGRAVLLGRGDAQG